MKAIALLVVLVGAVLVGYSLTLEPYVSGGNFAVVAVPYGNNAAYDAARAAALTPKYALQDYGITLMATGAILFLAVRHGRAGLKSPRYQAIMVAAALLLPVLATVAVGFDVVQAAERGEYPPWGDAIMIGLVVLPILMIPLLLWSLSHLVILWPRGKQGPTPLVETLSPPRNGWILGVSVITAGLTIYFAVLGAWWMAIVGAGWLYFYLSLAADRRATPAPHP